jgi:multidrug efflux pump
VKAMLITASQRVRPVLLTATVTALGVIPMALNVEFDFIRREITVGGLAGGWFVHLSAALVSGLFVSTALTLVMVPVMITAPYVIWGQIKGIGRFFAWIGGALLRPFRGRAKTATAPAGGLAYAIPEGADSTKQYFTRDGSGLIEREEDGVTIVSRQAAE